MLSIVDAISSTPFFENNRAADNESNAMRSCERSCEASYHEEGAAAACKQGCVFQAPNVRNRKKMVR